MSISGALHNALSGLTAAGKASEVVSNNIANALNPDYGPRALSLAARSTSTSGGVAITGVTRQVDAFLLSDRRLASAELGFDTTQSEFLSRLESVLGTPNEAGSLTARLADFDNALVTAVSRPDAAERLDSAVNAARELSDGLNRASEGVQTARRDAEFAIKEQVNRLNQALEEIAILNGKIVAGNARSNDTTALFDHRQTIVNEISEMVPVRIDDRAKGAIAIYSTGGAILLDGNAAQIGFDANTTVTAYTSIDNGTLSGLTINGSPLSTSKDSSPLRGGTLIGHFAVRDELAVEAQNQLDAIARDLIERFNDASVDPTITPGDTGLFTDAGAVFDPVAEVGLATRISLNAAVDPSQGGESWHLRDGIYATTPGYVGDSSVLQAMTDAMNALRTPASGDFGTGSYSAASLASTFLSQIASDRLQSDQRLSFSSTQHDELTQMELARGVDSDAELQRLIVIEQVYAANARIIEVAEDMLERLTRI